MHADALDIRQLSTVPSSQASYGFLKFLRDNPDCAFQEIFVHAYILLDIIWLEKSATYFDYPIVSKAVCGHVKRVVGSRRFELASDIVSRY